ncbi:MAG: OmpA family protein [Pseudomonadota bacterium]
MCNWKRWTWPGIILSALLTVLALLFLSGGIERDLTARTDATLEAAGLEWSSLRIDGRDLTVVGLAFSDSERERAVDLSKAEYGVRVVRDATGLIPPQRPYNFAIARNGDDVSLSGHVPSEPARADVLAAIKTVAPDVQITDNLELARGAPDGYSALTGFAISQFAGLSEGRFALTDTTLSASGVAANDAAYTSITGALDGSLPGGGTLGESDIRPPLADPYFLSMRKSDTGLDLTGFIPSNDARASTLGAAEAAFPTLPVNDRLRLASGQPNGLERAVSFSADQLENLSSGVVTIDGTGLSVRGNALDSDKYRDVLDAYANDVPSGFEAVGVRVMPPVADPYLFEIEKSAESVVLTGVLPSEAAVQDLADRAEAAAPGAALSNATTLASGAPAGFVLGAGFAADQLANLSAGKITLNGRTLDASGIANTPESYASTLSALESDLPQAIMLGDVDIIAPNEAAYGFSAVSSGNRIVLAGQVPNEDARAEANGAAQTAFPGFDIVDQMVFASGEPANYQASVDFSLSQLAQLEAGEAGFTPEGFYLDGRAKNIDSFRAASAALSGNLPEGLVLNQNGLMPPVASPYTWSAEFSDAGIALNGFVPSEDVRRALLAKAAEIGAPVTDNMVLADGAPDGFANAAEFGLGQLNALEVGTASLSDADYSISGRAPDSVTFESETNQGTTPPEGFVAAGVQIEPPVVSDYPFAAELDGLTVTLSGFSPSAETRAMVEDMAQSKFSDLDIVNELQIGSGAPSTYEAGVGYGLDVLTRFKSGLAGFNGDAFFAEGIAKTVPDFVAATAQLDTMPQGFSKAAVAVGPASVSPYRFVFVRNPQAVTLTGFAPDAAARTATEDAVSLAIPNVDVVNQMQIASGLPEDVNFQDAVSFATGQLSELQTGEVEMVDGDYSISGVAANVEAYDAVSNALSGDLPAGLNLSSQRIDLPIVDPYVWSASRNEDRIELSGNAPSTEEIDQLGVYAADRFSGLEITSSMTRAGGAPTNFDSAASAALNTLSRMRSGTATLTGRQLTVEGETFTPSLRDELTAAVLSGLPAGFVGEANITAPELEAVEVERCDALVVARMADATIGFETAKAVIKSESFGLLDELSGIVARCPGARVEVNGHTDSDGSETYNQRLSEARANAVRTYIVEAGVEPLRIRARGFGESQPIADNETDEGKAKNRRIEFKIVE